MPPPLPGPLAPLAPLLGHYGYWAVGAVVFLEDFGVPAPGETILLAAGVYAGAGELNIVAVAVVAFAAAVLGDNVGYLIGRTGGRALVERWGKYILLTPQRFEAAEAFFRRHGGKIVTVARFVEGLRQANGIIAGTTGMPWPRFLVFNALGAALWVGLWSSLAYLAGSHITAVYDEIVRYQRYVLIAVALLVAALAVRHLVRRRRPRGNDAGQ
ncbi:DedA family protein [Streptomyces griseoluteus]|uniref:DedA family protein n=1 Tax=Streptomyces griseoluteus TaxID=29306 RepID=UPI0034237437